MFTQKEHDLSWICTASFSNSDYSRSINLLFSVELLFSHRIHHIQELFNPVRRFLLLTFRNHVCIEAWDHAYYISKTTHVQHGLELISHISQSELPCLDLFDHMFLLLLSHRLLHSLHKSSHISKTK